MKKKRRNPILLFMLIPILAFTFLIGWLLYYLGGGKTENNKCKNKNKLHTEIIEKKRIQFNNN